MNVERLMLAISNFIETKIDYHHSTSISAADYHNKHLNFSQEQNAEQYHFNMKSAHRFMVEAEDELRSALMEFESKINVILYPNG